MRIIRLDRLADFGSKHPDAASPLAGWTSTVERSEWRSLVDIRKTYRHADGVKLTDGRTVTIFNIKGNHYRLIASIDYRLHVVNVLRMLTHAEYSKDRWKESL